MTRFLFSFSFLLLSLMMGVRAANYVTDDGFEYTIRNDGNIRIEKYVGNSEIINVPEYIDNLKVTQIARLFITNNSIKEIFIPKTILEIKSSLFWTASALENIIIGNCAFDDKPASSCFDLNDSKSFKSIIVDGNCSYSEAELSAINSEALKKGTIEIFFENESSAHTFTIYIRKDKGNYTLDFDKYQFLLHAIDKLRYNTEAIKEINLNKLQGFIINFGNNDPTSLLPAGAQVIDNAGNLYYNIDDLADNYSVPTSTISGLITYSRSNTAGWNTVCLPFDVKESDFPTGTEIYQMSSDTEDAIYLSRIEEGTTLLAGTPCFIWSPQDAKEWNLSINGEITANIPAGITTLNHWSLQGSFETRVLGTGYYKLNSAGDAFVMTTSSSHTFPFRCYIAPTPTNGSAPARLGMGIDEEASITLVPNDGEPQQVKLYDLMGRPRQGNAAGLFVPAKR